MFNVARKVEECDTHITYKERRNCCKNRNQFDEADYGDLDFILRSTVVVER